MDIRYNVFLISFFTFLFFLFNFVVDREKNYFSVDEKLHIKNSEYILNNSFFVKDYTKFFNFPAPTTPLANMFFSIFLFASNNIVFLRLVNLGVSFFCIFIFKKILEEYKINDDFKLLSFALFPYFVILSQIVMTDVFALTITLISVYFFAKYEKSYEKKHLILSSIFACLSFFSRQYYLFIIASHFIYLFFKRRKDVIYYLFFITPVVIYVLIQKGLTPIEYRSSYNIEFLPLKIFSIASVGFYFLPQIFKIKIQKNVIILFLICSLLFLTPLFKISCTGITCRLINYKVFGAIFSFFGLILIYDFMKDKNIEKPMILYLLFFFIEQLFNSMSYDRYFLSIYWVFVLYSDKKLSKIQFAYLFLISTVYILYKLFLL